MTRTLRVASAALCAVAISATFAAATMSTLDNSGASVRIQADDTNWGIPPANTNHPDDTNWGNS